MSKRKHSDSGPSTGYLHPSFLPSPPRPTRRFLSEGEADIENIEYREDQDDQDAPDYANEPEPAEVDEDEVDPLDAFMAGIHEEVNAANKAPVQPKPKREDLEPTEEDPMETFLSARRDAGLSLAAEALAAGYDSDEEVYAAAKAVDAGMVEYDSDDNPIVIANRKKIEPLPPLDHSSIDYEDFEKDFYAEHPDISNMAESEVTAYKEQLRIRTSGFDVPRPIRTFGQVGLDSPLLSVISKLGYEKPMPIQCQALPIALSGRDLIGIAKTGSGKTAAFVIPMIVHIMDQPELAKGEGPIGVICAPTRELAHQICIETRKFAKAYSIRVSGVYGGMSKFEQFKELKAGCEVVIATPGRLIDMIKSKALKLEKTTYLVLDEADRMFDMGFEPQIRSIVGQIRPSRQTLLFSATMPKRVERLAYDILTAPIRITVGEIGQANEDITQIVHVLGSEEEKLPWMIENIPSRVDEGEVLVFASTKVKVEELEEKLREVSIKVGCLHGDKDQASRMEVLEKFKAGVLHVLVATDVAARGLNIMSIKTVVNYDAAKDMDAHVHRVGRTGRAGDKDGVAITLITQKEARFACDLVKSLIAAGQTVSEQLMNLAMKDSKFRAARERRHGIGKGKGKGKGRGTRGVDYGLGLGYVDAPTTNSSSPEVPRGGAVSAPLSSGTRPGELGRGSGVTRFSALSALKSDIAAKFKSSFVSASTNTMLNAVNHPFPVPSHSSPVAPAPPPSPASPYVYPSPSSFSPASSSYLSKFVSANKSGNDEFKVVSPHPPGPRSSVSSTHNQRGDRGVRDYDRGRSHDEKRRERRRPSGWDR